MRTYRCWMLLPCLLGAGCAHSPASMSYLYGERYYRANTHTYSTSITAIDGRSTMTHTEPVLVEPGRHVIRLATAAAAGFRTQQDRELDLVVEPCMRYYIVAERDNRLQQNWRPVIEHAEPAGDCR